ncbi:MAG: hypothetical protein JSS32_00535 [Verrucomicrobia bacterium]|nr:hypothetical protein [Verrucomicrobiota bacterium]
MAQLVNQNSTLVGRIQELEAYKVQQKEQYDELHAEFQSLQQMKEQLEAQIASQTEQPSVESDEDEKEEEPIPQNIPSLASPSETDESQQDLPKIRRTISNRRYFPLNIFDRQTVVLNNGFAFGTYEPFKNPVPSWQRNQDILVAENGGPMDSFRLYNISNNTSAGARFDSVHESETNVQRIEQVVDNIVTLSNGSSWTIDSRDVEKLSNWESDDRICVSNNASYSDMQGLLINADREGEYVRIA